MELAGALLLGGIVLWVSKVLARTFQAAPGRGNQVSVPRHFLTSLLTPLVAGTTAALVVCTGGCS